MKQYFYLIFFFLVSLFLTNTVQATVFQAKSDGNWGDSSTWDQGSVPGPFDDVFIDGHIVTIDILTGDVSVKSITVANNSGNAKLRINGLVNITVIDYLEAKSVNLGNNTQVVILNGAIVNIGGYVEFKRTATNNVNVKLRLSISNDSRMNISGDFIFDYKNADASEAYDEIDLNDKAILDVTGNTYLYMGGGKKFKFDIGGTSQAILRGDLIAEITGGIDSLQIHNHSILSIEGNVILNSYAADKKVVLQTVEDGSIVEISGDISMSAESDEDVFICLKKSSNLYVAGNFFRPTNFGVLKMEEASTLTYNGKEPQEIAAESLPGAGTDAFVYTNVVLDNPSGFLLTDTMVVNDNLDLSSGSIETTSENIIIIGDSATITGGSEAAYIKGPMIKKGSSNGENFVFPIGNENTYAPIEISAISDISSEYVAQYFSDPPPFGNNYAPGVESISEDQYWTLNRTAGSEDVNVVLHWMDGEASKLNDLATLLVVGLNEDDNVWENFGNGGTTGGTGSGEPGSVASASSDPPPFGIGIFTIGSTEKTVTGINGLFIDKPGILRVYPNPVDNMLNINGDNSLNDEGMLEVYDINGRRIYSGKSIIDHGRLQISTSTINVHSSGTYIVRFTTAKESYINKFYKQ